MANYQACTVITLPAGEDLTGDYAEVLKLNATGQVIKTAAATDIPIGVLAESAPSATVGQGVAVAVLGGGGVIPMKAGAAIVAGSLVVLDATAGRVNAAAAVANVTDDSFAIGHALDAAADGEIFRVLAQVFVA